MISSHRKLDTLLLFLLVVIAFGVPLAIGVYDQHVWNKNIPAEARKFTLTGHMEKGWIVGTVKAYDVLSFKSNDINFQQPIIRVRKGDLVVLKLTSSDVVHGFSLKDFGIFIKKGISPGKVTIISFTADKTGTFVFSCNAICGKNHQNMKGRLVVTA